MVLEMRECEKQVDHQRLQPSLTYLHLASSPLNSLFTSITVRSMGSLKADIERGGKGKGGCEGVNGKRGGGV
jgi:hypothetical protein